MGVTGWNIFKPKEVPLESLNGSIIGIDTYYLIKRYVARKNLSVQYSIMSGLLYFVLNLLEIGALPIFVYDGITPEHKRGQIHKRYFFNHDELTELYRKTGTLENPQIDFDYMINRTKQLLTALGIQFITASEEADNLLAGLSISGQINYVFSSDRDFLAYGVFSLITHIDLQNKVYHLLNLDTILSQFDISLDQLRDLAILCGNDYFSGIKGIGPKNGISLLKQYGDLWTVLVKLNIRPTREMLKARKRYERTERRKIPLLKVSPKESQLRNLLSDIMKPKRIENAISRLNKTLQKQTYQTCIDF